MVALTQNSHRSHQHSAFPRTYPQNSNRPDDNEGRKNSSSWWPSALLDGLVNPPETHHPTTPIDRQKRPNYPTTIEFTPSEDGHQPFDEEEYSLLGLDRHHTPQMQVQGESFEFDQPNPDEELNRLYYGEEQDDEETTQTTFMGLNPYHSNAAPNELDNAIFTHRQQSNQQQREARVIQHQSQEMNRSSSHAPSRQQQQQSGLKSALRNKPKGGASIISPATAMERRRSQKHPTATPSSPTSITRSRSHSRSNRSSSRDIHRTSSRSSRSRSRGPAQSDDYHSSVFRGAELIKEQLIRSMASADHAMDEANKEFMSDTNDDIVYRRQQKLARVAKDSGEEDIDFDYSGKYQPEQPFPITPPLSRTSGNNVRFAVNEAHEEESQRLDDLARIFMSSSVSTGKSGGDKSKTSSKSSSIESKTAATVAKTEDGWQQQEVKMMMGTRVVSPTESAEPSNATPPSSNNVTHQGTEETKPMSNIINSVRIVSEMNPQNLDQEKFRHMIQNDEALAHAQRAGDLWRALVGNHVRFPSKWETILGSSKPPIPSHLEWSKWYYIARHRVKGDKRLNSREGVRSRRSGGRILLRLVVKEMHSQNICREIVVGCFHPSSKGIRRGDPKPADEDVREVYMAVRWTMYEADEEPRLDLGEEHDDYEGVVDNFLMQRRTYLNYSQMGSPLGHRKAVKNENVKAVFGDQPPSASIELHEDEFAEILKSNGVENVAVLPALVLLKLFLFSR
mmetsp:Transcript_6875/g.10020  ORF Transcript_6875/g.10020 Transcript_6875/m.10020 type:complete len:735 (-) Transcript_6875:178-2382(-)|eukprot:CAMPEP_0201697804 /NCGR_PEP_ID=MMETSP0578-20130828/14092_1 /ASSEMBLY_ACC=CAM_ASM_000663 /TAXON_ID=267565 /ORGANISM="Skeletonema grethea, Strain CCMP 1804" /LENGTH=734 /DNA_ID=CAMNT_0048184125 /DNA_START=202 /DNA_END=2406 /DNA_ORIENTATION=+